MSDKNIYQILESLDAAQRGVKQLPALFKPKDTSPQLSGPYPGRNATLGYLVGEQDIPPTVNRGGHNKLRDRKDYLDKRDILFRQLTPGIDAATRIAIKDRLAQLEKAAELAGLKEGDETGWGSETGDSGADETPDGVSPDTQSFLDEEHDPNPMTQAVTRRIVNQHPEWITRYGVELLMQVIDDVTEDETDWEEIGSSDVSAFVNMVGDQLRDRGGSREEMRDRRPFAEKGVAEDEQRYKFQRIKFRGTDHDIGEERYRFVIDADGRRPSAGDTIFFNFPSDEDNPDPDSPSFEEILARVQRSGEVRHYRITPAEQQAIAKKIAAERRRYLDQRRQDTTEGHADQQRKIVKRNGKPVGEIGIDRESSPGGGMYYMKHYASGLDLGGYDSFEEAMDELRYAVRQGVAESKNTTEDVISTVKKKLGDYLSDLSKEIKSDPDLKDKLERDIDQIGPAVKTLKTDDGHEIRIHGNEDDGFRITIKNREAKTRFRDLDEATMAVEMYCARRRGAVMEKDYLEER